MLAPRMMNRTMATTLIMANQYSIEPKLLTDLELKYSSTNAKLTDHIHSGVSGKQKGHGNPARPGLTADRDHLRHPIGIAHDEPRPGAEVDLGISAERSGGW